MNWASSQKKPSTVALVLSMVLLRGKDFLGLLGMETLLPVFSSRICLL